LAGRLTALTAKRKAKCFAPCCLAEEFESGITYTEREVNALLFKWHTLGDLATIRRELFSLGFLDREKNGSSYRLADNIPIASDFDKPGPDSKATIKKTE